MKRRDFLSVCGGAGLMAALPGCAPAAQPFPPGELGGGDFEFAHRLRLRQSDFPAPVEEIDIPVLIVGAGVSGLSAAWRMCRGTPLEPKVARRFIVLELENQPGGNARYAENAISRYPLGAHYLPLPNREARGIRELLAELGVLRGDPAAEMPEYDERYLCHAPQERLYRLGVWQEGLVPRLGVPGGEQEQQERFFERMTQFREARDAAGHRAFALPMAYSSASPEWAALDGLSMRDWMLREGFDAPSLHWYVNYACRDDYGTEHRHVSAWAGIHYFACRAGRGNTPGDKRVIDAVLTAPEGNGWLIDGLRSRIARSLGADEVWLRAGQGVFALRQHGAGCEADVWDKTRQRSVRYRAEHLIWAAPLFLLPRVASDLPADLAAAISTLTYAPWLVANLSLKAPPAAGAGLAIAWDNVLQDSAALGYVVSTHQQIRSAPGPLVLTYYYALAEVEPALARQMLLDTTQEAWAGAILSDLSRAHSDIRDLVTRLDVFRYGHAMARPLPGFRDATRRKTLAAGWEKVRLAHTDVSGLSLFEEANYHGIRAAEDVLAAFGALREKLV